MSLEVFSVRLPVDQIVWLKCQPNGGSGMVRNLVAKAINEPREALERMRKMRPKDRLFEAVRMVFHPRRAQRLANVRTQDMNLWAAKDPAGFKSTFAECQRDFIDDAEWMVLECARGERAIDKQGMTGLIAFLNNHHPSWGRIKIELLSRVFNPIFDCLLRIVKETVDDTTYQEIAERFQQERDMHFSAFSE